MRIVVTGASGQLGSYLVEHLESLGLSVHAWSFRSRVRPLRLHTSTARVVDLRDEADVLKALDASDPDIIFHLGAVSSADAVHADPAEGFATNVTATGRLADWCSARGRRIVFTSTDLVFDGTRSFSREEDAPNPILMYGRTKFESERAILETRHGLVARLSLLYGPSKSERIGFFDRAISSLRRGIPQTFFEDEYRTPLDYGSAVAFLARLALSDREGVIHVAGRERMSRRELMGRIAGVYGLDPRLVKSNRRDQVTLREPRPCDVSLDTTRLAGLYPELDEWTVEKALELRA